MNRNQQTNQRTGHESTCEATVSEKNGLLLEPLKTETQSSIDISSNYNIKYGTLIVTILVESNC